MRTILEKYIKIGINERNWMIGLPESRYQYDIEALGSINQGFS
jgi:hypothetical protein